jgi:hypothetical protein
MPTMISEDYGAFSGNQSSKIVISVPESSTALDNWY